MPRLPRTLSILGLLLAAPLMGAEEAVEPQPETDRRMDEVLQQRAIKREADRIAGQHALEQGRRLNQEGRLEEALKSLEKAASLLPADVEVQAELQAVRSALGVTADRRHEILSELSKAKNAREDQQRVLVESKIREGERLIAAHRHADALQVLKEAQETVRWMSYGSAGADQWRLAVSDLLNQAERGAQEEAALKRETQMQKAESEAAQEYELAQAQRARRLESLRAQGREALAQSRWLEAERVADEIDALVPGDSGASQMKLLSRERRHVDTREATGQEYAEEWANLREMSREQQIPYAGQDPEKIMRHPDNWEAIRQRARETLTGNADAEPAWKQVYRDRLRKIVHYKFPGIAFKEAKEFLEHDGRVTINVSKAATDANAGLDELPITLASPDDGMTLESALNILAKNVGLAWTLRDETIQFTTVEDLVEPAELEQYDVRDLIGDVKDFVAPAITIGGGGASSSPGIILDTVEESEEEGVTGDTLTEFIKEYVDKAVWAEPENTIQFKNGKLFVTAPPKTHKKILEVLKGFRDQRTLQVLIQSRFIVVSDISFENIGVDWQGLNVGINGSAPAVNPSLVGYTNPVGATGNVVGPGFWNSGVLHTQGAVQNNGQFLGGIFPRTFNGALSTGGGMSAQIAFLDDFQVQAILNAVEKSGKANVLTAPTLMAFNTQRANMVNVIQQAYIQDYTAVVQVQAVGYDPEIGYVMTGIVFDVRPIVSADRKYITLELRPTVSQLNQLRSVPAGANNGAFLFIEAPIVQMQAIRTTVSVPDGGTLMIGGLTEYDETQNYVAVPFLSKIPFLKSLFSSRADAQNRRSLVILVKAQVIDQKEIEESRFGKE